MLVSGLFLTGCSSPTPIPPDALTPAGLPAVPVLSGEATGHIDRINGTVVGSEPLTIAAAAPTTLFGWALDGAHQELASEVYVEIGGQGYRAQYFQPRPDVGAQYGKKESLQFAGFSLTLAGGKLSPGNQSARLHIVSHDRAGQYVSLPVPLTVR